ncbi:phage tail domain-containing protein [Faecalispora jeddahensis]|uniref:phage tail domain-containing protein n=1 Tax=Faecalispora jeddahensis TaxID=1414721 RepID=UPI00189B7CCE|nr:phage tail domain-containing protein [Faecalispora jeddahensis]
MQFVCENAHGEKLAITEKYKLLSADGLGAAFDIYTSQNSGQDGVTYNNSTAKMRNIVLVFDIYKQNPAMETDALYQFFQPRSHGVLYHKDGGKQRKIGYYVEKLSPSGYQMLRTITLSLICPDPKWYDLNEQLTELASWEGLIEWDLEITEEPFELTRKVNTLIGNVYNGSNVTQGLKVKFMATGEVVNPSLYNIDRQELMKLNLTMHPGDTVMITTAQGNKRVKLTSGGVTTNINNYMAYPPVWLQAYPGDNLYRYDAESGIDNLNVTITHTQAYWGV